VVELAGPEAGTVHVWWARRLDASDRLAGLLDATEQQRLAAYRRDEDRQRFLVGCALAKTVLAGYAGLRPADMRFDRTCAQCGRPHGKPVIKGGAFAHSVSHSVSHSGDLVAVAVARSPVGVDVEQLDGRGRPLGGDGDTQALARMVLADGEQAALAAVRPSARAREFLAAWTRKEAVTKATGDGLRVSFSDVVIVTGEGAPRVVAWPYPQPPESVSLMDLEVAVGYVAALAVLGRCGTVQARDGSALLAAPA
jgi:4'-phosphopantetheinyl transferase